jgi:hypothetical protein
VCQIVVVCGCLVGVFGSHSHDRAWKLMEIAFEVLVVIMDI